MVYIRLDERVGESFIIFKIKLFTWKVSVLYILKSYKGNYPFINLQFIAYYRPPYKFHDHVFIDDFNDLNLGEWNVLV
jgi:hypothetical protein